MGQEGSQDPGTKREAPRWRVGRGKAGGGVPARGLRAKAKKEWRYGSEVGH